MSKIVFSVIIVVAIVCLCWSSVQAGTSSNREKFIANAKIQNAASKLTVCWNAVQQFPTYKSWSQFNDLAVKKKFCITTTCQELTPSETQEVLRMVQME